MGIPVQIVKGELVPKDNDPIMAYHVQLREEE